MMQELTRSNALAYHTQVVQSPVREPVSRVSGAADGSSTGSATDWRAASGTVTATKPAQTEETGDDHKSAKDPFALTGPTPAFQANVLDVENDVRSALARIEVTRQKSRHDEVFGESGRTDPPAPTEKPAAGDEPTSETAQQTQAAETAPSPFATLGTADTNKQAG